jgi:hypothetical protein
MKENEYDRYLETVDAAAHVPVVTLDEVGNSDRTLAFGYTCERHTWHAYVHDNEIHVVVYDNRYDGPVVVAHHHGAALEAHLLQPDKRVYPNRTEFAFAILMAAKGFHLPFTRYSDPERFDSSRTYQGHIAQP